MSDYPDTPVTIWVDDPHVGSFDVTGVAGTNFGLRISAEEVVRLYSEHKWHLPFDIMSAGYGDDSDWVGIQYDDFDEGWTLDATYEELEQQWGPFELSIGPMREPTAQDIEAANDRGYAIKGGIYK